MTSATDETAQGLTPDEAFGRAVYMVMFDRGVKGTELARHMGLDQSYLSKKLHGKSRWTLDEMIIAAAYLDVDLRDLLDVISGEPDSPGEPPRGIEPRTYALQVPGSVVVPVDFVSRQRTAARPGEHAA